MKLVDPVMNKEKVAIEIAFRDARDTFGGSPNDWWEELSQPARERYLVAADIAWTEGFGYALAKAEQGWQADIRVRNSVIEDLRQALTDVDRALKVPAAEYVPAIADAMGIIDKALKASASL